jgi:hypothetical protein
MVQEKTFMMSSSQLASWPKNSIHAPAQPNPASTRLALRARNSGVLASRSSCQFSHLD